MKVVIVTGSVCSGKTTISKRLANDLNFEYVDVNKVIEKHPEVVSNFNKELDTKEIDVKKLVKVLTEYIKGLKKSVVVDSHLSHFLPKSLVNVCVILKCDLKILKRRLEERGYNQKKIDENVEAEIMESCFVEALENGHKIILADSSKDVDYNLLLAQVEEQVEK